MQLVDEFCDELRALGLDPVLDNDNLNLKFDIDIVDPKKVTALINKYVGFFKSVGISNELSLKERVACYHIPLQWITGKDITDDQLLDITDQLSKKLTHFPITKYWIDLMKHAIGFKPGRVENGKYEAYRNYFAVATELQDWENMIQAGLAVKEDKFGEVVYHISDKGYKFLSDVLGIQILPLEEETEE